MKVRTKIALLLQIVVATFAAGLIAIKTYESGKYRRILAEHAKARQKSFDAFMQRWTEPMRVLAADYSLWDNLVAALQRGDRAWAAEHFGDGELSASRANVIWLYTPMVNCSIPTTTSFPTRSGKRRSQAAHSVRCWTRRSSRTFLRRQR